MMVDPGERVKELLKETEGWKVYDPDADTFYIRSDAPEKVKKAFEELKKLI